MYCVNGKIADFATVNKAVFLAISLFLHKARLTGRLMKHLLFRNKKIFRHQCVRTERPFSLPIPQSEALATLLQRRDHRSPQNDDVANSQIAHANM